jgi:hypothetical protein
MIFSFFVIQQYERENINEKKYFSLFHSSDAIDAEETNSISFSKLVKKNKREE